MPPSPWVSPSIKTIKKKSIFRFLMWNYKKEEQLKFVVSAVWWTRAAFTLQSTEMDMKSSKDLEAWQLCVLIQRVDVKRKEQSTLQLLSGFSRNGPCTRLRWAGRRRRSILAFALSSFLLQENWTCLASSTSSSAAPWWSPENRKNKTLLRGFRRDGKISIIYDGTWSVTGGEQSKTSRHVHDKTDKPTSFSVVVSLNIS